MSTQLTVGATKNRISRARSSMERILAFSLLFSLLAHGLFFAREVLAMGGILAFYEIWRGRLVWSKASFAVAETDILLLGMVILSLSGLLNPVKAEEAWLEGIRYLIYWFIYVWSREVSGDRQSRRKLLQISVGAALALALSGWLPWVSKIWPAPALPEAGRLSSWLGYPNATAAFLGAVFFLPGLNLWLRLFIFLSILSTGSRSAIILLLLLKGIELFLRHSERIRNSNSLGLKLRAEKLSGSLIWQGVSSVLRVPGNARAGRPVFYSRRSPVSARGKKSGVMLILMLITITLLAGIELLRQFYPAVAHLFVWGPSKSLGERLLYFKDGFRLAWMGDLLPRAGGWLAFPLVQQIPYWTLDPHSSLLHILLDQGLPGVIGAGAWIFFWLLKAGNALKTKQKEGDEGRTGIFFAVVFLLAHSVVDADLSFAALGIFFWLLIGQLDGGRPPESKRTVIPKMLPAGKVSGSQALVSLFLSIFLLLAISRVLFPPNILLKGSLSRQSALNIPALEQALAADQSNVEWQKKLAELDFRQGEWDQGFKEVKRVLAWARFDVGAYEWAQGTIWEAAESQRPQGNQVSRKLYQWVAQVPELMQEQAEAVPLNERYLWSGYAAFHSNPHIDLLAKQAGKLTFYPP